MNSIRVALISSLGATLTAGCATGAPPANVSSTSPNIGRALQEVDASDFLKHIEALASDDFEGRSVGARGEAVTVDYLVGEFKRIGLMPGNPDGSYIQRVPLTEHTSAPSAIIKEKGLVQISDTRQLETAIRKVMEANPSQVAEYKAGKVKLLGFFVGQVMKAMAGKANPQLVNERLRAKLTG